MARAQGSSRAHPDKTALAHAVMAAAEPLVEVLLELGITSPEAESLLRGVFVHVARDWLIRRGPAEGRPSDVRIALASGVHRNFVRRILAGPPRIAAARERKGHRASRLLEAWHTDPAFLDSNGKPRDLYEREPEPSFHTLSSRYVPGTAPGILLRELRRAGLVQILAEHRVRVRARSFRPQGLSGSSLADMGRHAQSLLRTMVHNLQHPQAPLYCERMPEIEVDASELAFVRDVIARRASGFLDAIAQELAAEAGGARRRRSVRRVRIGLSTIATER